MRAIFYHGVVDRTRTSAYYASIFADRRDFERDVSEVARYWQPMSLTEIAAHVRDGRSLPPRAVHVSFDDGFANTLDAAEVLDRHGIPWTLFVVVDAVLSGYEPWFVRVANALEAARNVQCPDGSVVELGTAVAKWRFARRVKASIMAAPALRHEEVVEEILTLRGMPSAPEPRWTLLPLPAIRQLLNAGVEIGNHSARHPNLNRGDDETLVGEICDSKQRLEAALGRPVRGFAYPDGRYNRTVARIAASSHDLAMSVWRPGATWRPGAIPRRAGGVGPLEQTLAQSDVSSVVPWLRAQAPLRAAEMRHRFLELRRW